MEKIENKFLNKTDAAKFLKCSPQTLMRYVKKYKMEVFRRPSNNPKFGRILFKLSDLQSLIK